MTFRAEFQGANLEPAYYFDATNGDDGFDGLSQGQAWKTVAKASSVTDNPTYKRLFKCGELWRETLVVPANNLTFDSYGSGAKPRILGSIKITDWTEDTGHWTATHSSAIEPVWFITASDGKTHWGHKKASKALCVAEYDWYSNGTNIWVYAATDPDARYTSIEAAARNNCISHNGKSSIVLENIELAYPKQFGVDLNSVTPGYWTVGSCTIHHIGVINSASAAGISSRASHCTFNNNSIYEIGTHGININADVGNTVTDELVYGNVLYNCYHADVQSLNWGLTGTISYITFSHNVIYSTSEGEWAGITAASAIYTEQTSHLDILYNIVYSHWANAIQIGSNADHVNILHNSLYKSNPGSSINSTGILLNNEGTITNIVIKDNISMDWKNFCLVVYTHASITTCDYNLWDQSAEGSAIYVRLLEADDYHYNDFAAYKAAYGYDTNGKWEDPHFTDPANADFTLQAGSPCIGAGEGGTNIGAL